MRIETITWDGNTEGLTSVTIEPMGLTLYRVSDKLIPPGEAKMTMAEGNTIPGAPTEAIPGLVLLTELLAFSAKVGEYDLGMGTPLVVPESGTYFAKAGDVYATAVSWETTEPEEPTAPIGFIEYLVNPKYRMGKPFGGIIGWKLAQKGCSADGEPALVSSDGYTLQDVNGLNLIPKEDE